MSSSVERSHVKRLGDRPGHYSTTQINGQAMKPLTQILIERRATDHFRDEPVPENILNDILKFGAQAPSGYNLQPWRFILVQNPDDKLRLRNAAMNQSKITEAPVVIIAIGMTTDWKKDMQPIFVEGAERGVGRMDMIPAQKAGATDFLSKIRMDVWVNRHVMIAFTTLMLMAESYGLDTAPMEGFDQDAVRREFAIPEHAEVVALLAIGFGKHPDKHYPGRLTLDQTVFSDYYGNPWNKTQ